MLLMAAITAPTMRTVSVQVTIFLSFLKMFIEGIVGAPSSRGSMDTMDFWFPPLLSFAMNILEPNFFFFFNIFIYLLMYTLHHSVTKLTIYNIILKSTYTLYNVEFTFDLHI